MDKQFNICVSLGGDCSPVQYVFYVHVEGNLCVEVNLAYAVVNIRAVVIIQDKKFTVE